MARKNAEPAVDDDTSITYGTGNVFADLGYSDAEARQAKLRLAYTINGVFTRLRITQATAAERLGLSQPSVSALANYKLDGFSVERLMLFLTALGQDVEIVIRRKSRSRAAGRISVVAA
jgi:predicted XRE-type DNA-binding protein